MIGAPRQHWPRSSGVTLLELIVALAVLGVILAVVGLSMAATDPVPVRSPRDAAIARARQEALRDGTPRTIVVHDTDAATLVTALPDGRVLGADSLAFDDLTGRRTHVAP